MGSGGRKANLAAIFEGQGGQQNRQQSSVKLRPIPLIFNDYIFLSGGKKSVIRKRKKHNLRYVLYAVDGL